MSLMFSSVIIPLLLFGGLVFFHELGHFSVAKWCNVYVERFAIGFGPAIFKKTFGETEYALCLFPLGGYVKMRGQEDIGNIKPEDLSDPRSFATQNVWNRIAIVIMGPVANLILPVVVFTGLFMVGIPSPSSQVGNALPDSPAYKAGLRAGDHIVSVQGQPVKTFKDVTKIVATRANLPTEIMFERNGQMQQATVTPNLEKGMNDFGEIKDMGKIGVDLISYQTTIGISDPKSVAYQQGLRTGHTITSVNGQPVSYFWQINDMISQTKEPIILTAQTSEDASSKDILSVNLGTITNLTDAGIFSREMFIAEVQEESIASQKGLRAGDHLIAINDQNISNWYEFKDLIQNNNGEELNVTLIRDGQTSVINLIPKEVTQSNALTQQKEKVRQLGVVSGANPYPIDFYEEQYTNPFLALKHGFLETYDLTKSTVIGLGKLFSGKLSYKTLGGPISIFYMAGTSYSSGGWMSFFRLMAILSITLGVLNLLPIPVLDGGHLFFYFIELIKGKPVPAKLMEWSQQAGLMILLGLMLLVFYVDIDRFFVDKIKALF
ncbi:MAG: RIP metalloprotease RseP [Bdellovibrionales bacterium]|nr:RIP metalloprotease RseP [Bdellovibrionales bacterium]